MNEIYWELHVPTPTFTECILAYIFAIHISETLLPTCMICNCNVTHACRLTYLYFVLGALLEVRACSYCSNKAPF